MIIVPHTASFLNYGQVAGAFLEACRAKSEIVPKIGKEGGCNMAFEGKKFILLGERDGIPGPVMEEVLKSLGCEVAFAVTECFV